MKYLVLQCGVDPDEPDEVSDDGNMVRIISETHL